MAKDLMLTVLKSGKTAKELCDHLQKLFQDNKGNRAATLESKFVNLKFVDCASVDDYCDKLKSLSDRLTDLDFPMNDKRLVIQLVNGLPEEYNTVASFIQQSMPTFDAARSQLRTEEIRRAQQTSLSSSAALAATASSTDRGTHRSHRSGSGSGKRGPRQPQPVHTVASPSMDPPLLPTPQQFHQAYRPPAAYYPQWNSYWEAPPCPYPTAPHWQSSFSPRGSTHGRSSAAQSRPRPPVYDQPQAYLAPSNELLQPTDFAQAYSSMTLQPPDDTFYMDT
ncbi:uncharacterized protein LOC113341950, partial [Papaver somniferum]|uniref:uncharacterized protein LOC113341950 n=1 Tax=Papaver somniferum TaxID=3469 RepID=UPI000E705B78